MSYLFLKWVHILSSTILFGTGIGSAFYMFMVHRYKSVAEIYFVTRTVVIADWVFTTPSFLIQILSGFALMHMVGYSYDDLWLYWGLILYLLAFCCWLPVVWIQMKMRNISKEMLDSIKPLPDYYWTLEKIWIFLGFIALTIFIFIFYLMVYKPEL